MLGWIRRKFTGDKLLILLTGLATSLLITGLYVHQPRLFRFLDRKIYDIMLREHHSGPASSLPVIVDIDEDSLAKYGQWPWPRYRIALLLDKLNQAGVLAVGTDIVFAEPDRTSPRLIKEEITGQFGQYLTGELEFANLPDILQDNDALLAATLETGPFVLGYSLEFQNLGHGLGQDVCGIAPLNLAYKTTMPGVEPDPANALFDARDAVCPLPVLTAAAPRAGFFTTSADMDGVIRRVPLLMLWNGRIFPNLALRTLFEACQGRAQVLTLSSAGTESLLIAFHDPDTGKVRKIEIPLDQRGQFFVNYRGPSETFQYISAGLVLEEDPATKAALQGKIALIGTSASGLKDLRVTPFDQYYPGVETHATIIDNILSEDFLRIPHWEPGLQVFAILVSGLLITVLLTWTGAIWAALPLVLLGWGLWAGSGHLFSQNRVFLSPLYSWIVLGISFTLLTLMKFWREEKQKRFIHGAFSHYLSPAVIARIVEDPDSLSLDGEEKEITIMFSDVRNFTSLSEKLTATQVSELLHEYLTPMTRIITNNSGTLDKFIGDGVMAFWNAPINVPEHEKKALAAAMEQLEKLKELNKTFVEKYGFPIAIGIGIHCGRVRVGNMGSADLFDYTLIGDNVNLTSRLEGLTKFYRLEILVSDAIRKACGQDFVFQEVDSVRVKGRDEPVTIHTVHDRTRAGARREELERYAKALAMYKARDFAGAEAVFADLAADGPPLYDLYRRRCRHLCEEPPGPEWDGVFTHEEK